jgi:nitroreductase
MPRRRLGFGKPAAVHLANLIEDFERRFGASDPQVRHAASVLREYRELHRDWPEPMPRLDAFLAARPALAAAAQPHVGRDAFFAAKDAPFAAFAASRHVVRHFAAPVPRAVLEKALGLAVLAPSACNRQHARVHVFGRGKALERLLELQGGNRGFGGDVGTALVVTADLAAVRWGWERHDAWTNGGLFVMNLCYALHHCGVAHCILHWSVSPETDREARRVAGIPDGEEIVCVVAAGIPPDEFDVASSPRLAPGDIVSWHE